MTIQNRTFVNILFLAQDDLEQIHFTGLLNRKAPVFCRIAGTIKFVNEIAYHLRTTRKKPKLNKTEAEQLILEQVQENNCTCGSSIFSGIRQHCINYIGIGHDDGYFVYDVRSMPMLISC